MGHMTQQWIDVGKVFTVLGVLLVLMLLCGCDLFNEQNPVHVDVDVDVRPPCGTCPDGTTDTAVTVCACTPIVRNGVASSCQATWGDGPTVCAWSASRASDGATDSGQVQRGGEIDPGVPGAGAGLWVVEMCGCQAGFNADS